MTSKTLQCPLCCNEEFTSYSSLKYHLLSIIDNLTCPACSKRFDKILDLAEHLGRECHDSNENDLNEQQMIISTLNIKTEDCGVEVDNNNYNNSILAQALLKKDNTTPQEQCGADKKSGAGKMKDSNQQQDTKERSTGDVNENEEYFYCSSCAVSFSSINEHLQQYHEGQEIFIEDVGAGDVGNEDGETFIVVQNKMLEEVEEEDEDSEDNLIDIADSNDYNTLRQEDITDKDGRLYTRKVVQIEKFWDESDEKNGKPPPKTQKYILENGKAIKVDESTEDIAGKHISVIHQCETCHLQFCKLEQYYTHSCDPMKNSQEYKCFKCDASFFSARSLYTHRKTHKTEGNLVDISGPFVCEVCSTEFPTYKSLRLHKRMHDPIKVKEIEPPVNYGLTGETDPEKWGVREMFVCQICNKTYDKQYEEVHMMSHSDEPKYDCEICNRKFFTQSNLEMHARVHSNSKKFTCSYCKKGFLNYESLQEHVKHTCQSRPYECQYCGRRFMRPHEKVKHERIHTGEKPHICEICGKGFRVSYCLTLHMRTHSGTRPYQCAHCGKRFKAHSVYNHHLLTHSTVRNYKCPYCPKAFKTGVQLAGHKNSHIKPFTCTECNRPFASLYAVRAHMETHKRENNLKYSCWLCGASYARAFALRDHIKEHHSGVTQEKPDNELLEPQYEMVAEGVNASNAILNEGTTNDVLVVLEQDNIENVEMVEEIAAVE
ncbi:hypothetical protein Trydic_g4787 [Trypoxylus dichotomus]